MVDAGAEKELLWEGDFSEADYALVGEGLRGAKMIVATHEHSDHIAGVIRGPWASAVEGQALLTAEQLETIVAGPSCTLSNKRENFTSTSGLNTGSEVCKEVVASIRSCP